MPGWTTTVRSPVSDDSAATSSAAVVTTIDGEAVDSTSGRERSEPDNGVLGAIATHASTAIQTAKRRCDMGVSSSGPQQGPYPSERKPYRKMPSVPARRFG